MTKDCAYANCLDVDDDWFNEQLPKPGDMCFVILDPLAKHGDKYSALELSINKIYKLPCPRELIDLSKESASTTSVKTSSFNIYTNEAYWSRCKGDQDQFRH